MKKIRLKENFFETEEFPRYHSNCRQITLLATSQAQTSPSPLRGATQKLTVVSAPGSEGMGLMELCSSALSIYRLSVEVHSDRLRHCLYLVVNIISHSAALVNRQFAINFRTFYT